jgi:hypothetical protein
MEWERALLSAAQPFAGSCVHTGLKSNCVHANRKGEYRTIIRQARLCGHNIQIKNTLKRATWVSPKAGQFTGGGGRQETTEPQPPLFRLNQNQNQNQMNGTKSCTPDLSCSRRLSRHSCPRVSKPLQGCGGGGNPAASAQKTKMNGDGRSISARKVEEAGLK